MPNNPPVTTLTKEELEKGLKSGEIKRIHLYKWEDVLMPRGSMEKESIGPYLLERLQGAHENFTDPQYSDNPIEEELTQKLYLNLIAETTEAWMKFIEWREDRAKPS